jgi:catechol 2,3-dioxygenase-like lactoylglutathione lyase family enzyme
MEIIGIDHVVIRCVDVERMMRFYCGIIGCTLERSREDLGLYHLRAGRSLIDLLAVSGTLGSRSGGTPEMSSRNMDHFCLRIDPFDEAAIRAHFIANGIELGDLQDNYGAEGDGPSFYVSDPEGNTVELKGPSR